MSAVIIIQQSGMNKPKHNRKLAIQVNGPEIQMMVLN